MAEAIPFADELWGGRIRKDIDLSVEAEYLNDREMLGAILNAVNPRLQEALRDRAHIEGREPYPANPPARRVATIEIRLNFKPADAP